MFDHVTIRVSDRAAERFYDTVLQPIGIERTHSDERYAEWGDFSLAQATPDEPGGAGCTSPSSRGGLPRSCRRRLERGV